MERSKKHKHISANALFLKNFDTHAELRLGKLGLFRFAEKNAMKEAIAQAETEIADAEKELEQAKQDLNTILAAIPAKVSAQESAIRKAVEEALVLPPEPIKPNP